MNKTTAPAEKSPRGAAKTTIVAAMSGGVDSSVAAALLKDEGFEVVGLTMNLFALSPKACRDEALRSCCGFRAVEDAHRVALALGLEHFVADFRKAFEDAVVADFCREYERGRTPNPCLRCNQFIKFDKLWTRARRLGAAGLATGHYARIDVDPDTGRRRLLKGVDSEKDQSYFLYTLTQAQLARTLFPLGGYRKAEVRAIARKLGLPVAEKRESQEICFVPDRDYGRFLRERLPEAFKPGPIVDATGKVLGRHDGILKYTVGQRKGMGIAAAHPLYVIAVDAARNTIVAGTNAELYRDRLVASDVNWIAGDRLTEPREAAVKIRYKHAEAKARLAPQDEGRIHVEFEKPQRAITPGQAAVFYDGEVVLGGGTIEL
jgi:tRNA-specific 2-thiouridylase